MSRTFGEFPFEIEQGVFVAHESREFVWGGEVGAQVESSEEKAIVDSRDSSIFR